MKAIVFHDIGDIRLENVREPKIEDKDDAIVRITTSAICGTDLHFIRGTVGPMKKGTILGHEAVGVVEEIGKNVRNLKRGDRVIVPSTISCGYCLLCRQGFYSQCNNANPNGPEAGTAFFGGPKNSGPLQGCQAEFVRVPFASNNLVKIPDSVSDDKAILLSDIFPTAYFGADMAQVKPGDVVVIQGCGPVGQFAIASCKLLGASRIFAIDRIPSRLELARKQGAEILNFDEVNPIEIIKDATEGTMANVVIDAVGVDAVKPTKGPALKGVKDAKEFKDELTKIAPTTHPKGKNWIPGDAPSQALRTGVELAGKCATISIIGVYAEASQTYPIGKAMNKNLKLVMGNCHHRAYIPRLLQLVEAGIIDPTQILTQREPLMNALEAYKQFDAREPGWIKVALKA
ncbi:MAG: glutathione-dependent formaldehyde dehydrogenase [Gammaproteobacteria bacterium]|nr:glutathione-dependent formaldehyde dehydrogenase [Gammaproteobacteria bacterium]